MFPNYWDISFKKCLEKSELSIISKKNNNLLFKIKYEKKDSLT